MSILLIEDNDRLRDVTKLVLEVNGYEVVAVESGAEALALLQNGFRPRVILLDLIMPDMDGFEFREQQMKDPNLASIPVVVWSGHTPTPSESQRLQGATFIPKPINPDVVLEALAALYQTQP